MKPREACSLLLIDDEEANLDLLEALLTQEGYSRLDRCADARSALDRFEAVQPDLVLLDLHMPHRGGLEILADIRSRTAPDDYLPVLVLTADATPTARERALAGGARDFVTKPFDAVEVCLRVRNLLDTRLLHAEQRAARERAETSERRSSLLAEAGRVLGSSRDGATCMAQLARIIAPGIADACLIELMGAEDDVQLIVAPAHAAGDRPNVDAIAESAPASHVVREPLGGVGEALGSITFGRRSDRAAFDDDDRALLKELARRAALTLENARLIAEAQQAVLARDQVLSVVAHDLRNPLTAMAANAELLKLQLPPDAPEKQRTMLERIERIAQRTHAQVEDLLEIARSSTAAIALKPCPVEAGVFFEEADALLRPLAQSRGIPLRFEGPPHDRPVLADPPRIVQVLSNLVGNALRFTVAESGISVTWRYTDTEMVVTVADDGPGIPIDQVPHVFNSFWRNDASDRRGAGLGLLIARTIVEAHGGRIWLESPGAGASFSFSLPLATPATTSAEGEAS